MRNKTGLLSFMLILAVGFLGGCALRIYPGGPTVAGGLITDVRAPAQLLSAPIDPTASCKKEGTATAGAFMGIFAFGDSSLTAAMKQGGITRIHHVDHETAFALFGLWSSDTLIVCGE